MRSRIWLAVWVVLTAAPALAQTRYPPLRNPYLTFTIGNASRTQDSHQQGRFSLYNEDAAFDVQHDLKRARFIDFGGGVRAWRGLFVGLTYTARRREIVGAPIEAFVPHPIFYDAFRTAQGTVTGMEYREASVHMQGIWRFEPSPSFQIGVFGGPSLFNVSHDLLEKFEVEESNGFMNVAIVRPTLRRDSEGVFGAHAGVDAIVRIVGHLGAGAMVRYSRALGSFATPENAKVELTVGGWDAGVRVRLGF